ncbi:MAG: OstA-like protein [Bacteroidota bacterium]
MKQHANKQSPSIPYAVSRSITTWFLVLLLLGGYARADNQDDIQVKYGADHLENATINGEPCQKLRGNVVFNLEQLTIKADSALYYHKKRRIDAQGNIKIIHKDGSTMVADRLIYEEETQLAQLRGHVILKSEETIFYADHFHYNTKTKQGHFVQGGRLVEGDNVLTSEAGSYNDVDKIAVFQQHVKLVSPDYTVQCDKMHYNTVTKIAKFKGRTKITSNDGKQTLTTDKGGEYNTNNQQSTFVQSQVAIKQYTLYGSVLKKDKKGYTATGQVRLVDKKEDIIIEGDHGKYQEEQGIAKVWGNGLMTKLLEEDTLYVSADTFEAIEDKATEESRFNTVKAYPNVKIYKDDLQGKADSLVYQEADSTLYFYGDPIFWSNKTQLTADSAHLLLQERAFDAMHMDTNAFVVSEDDLGNFNQIQGRSMVAHFKENKVDHVEIDGNAESIYFLMEKKGQLQGMNRMRCAHIHVLIKENGIAAINTQKKVVGAFYPPSLIPEDLKRLDNFSWRMDECPTKQEVVAHGYGTHPGYKAFKLHLQATPSSPNDRTLKK